MRGEKKRGKRREKGSEVWNQSLGCFHCCRLLRFPGKLGFPGKKPFLRLTEKRRKRQSGSIPTLISVTAKNAAHIYIYLILSRTKKTLKNTENFQEFVTASPAGDPGKWREKKVRILSLSKTKIHRRKELVGGGLVWGRRGRPKSGQVLSSSSSSPFPAPDNPTGPLGGVKKKRRVKEGEGFFIFLLYVQRTRNSTHSFGTCCSTHTKESVLQQQQVFGEEKPEGAAPPSN